MPLIHSKQTDNKLKSGNVHTASAMNTTADTIKAVSQYQGGNLWNIL